jgi:hypothetical protein
MSDTLADAASSTAQGSTDQAMTHQAMTHQAMTHRPCIRCRRPMLLVGIEADASGGDVSTFTCSSCFHLESVAVERDPMTSGGNGWAASNLYAPT